MPTTKTYTVKPSSTPVDLKIEIPDPVPKVIWPDISFTQPDIKITESGRTDIPVTDPGNGNGGGVIIPFQPKAITGEILGGGRGLMDFYDVKAFPYDSRDKYWRTSWQSLQKDATTYDFSILDSICKKCVASNQKILFRIGLINNAAQDGYVIISGMKACYPAFLHTLMMAESVKPWNDGKTWYVNWNSESLLSYWEKLLQATAKFFKDNYPYLLYSLDFGGYGNYLAEWHMDSINEPAPNKATDKTLLRFLSSHVVYFPDTYLLTNVDMFDPRYASDVVAAAAITWKNNKGLFGFRSDHVGWIGTTAYDKQKDNRVVAGVNIGTELKNRRLYAPCIAEPMNGTSGLAPAGGKNFDTLYDEVIYYGFSLIENECDKSFFTNADVKSNFMRASAIAGYNLRLVSGSINGSSVITNWAALNVAPVYEDYEVWFEIRNGLTVSWSGKSAFSPKSLMPGTTKSLSDPIGPDKGNLYIIIKDPTGYRKPLALSCGTREQDGSYFLCTIS